MKTRLEYLRTKNNLTLRDLAEKTDIHFTTLGNIELGKREIRLEQAIALADYFGVSLDYFVYRENEDAENYFKTSIEEIKKSIQERNMLKNTIDRNPTQKKIIESLFYFEEDDLKLIYNMINKMKK